MEAAMAYMSETAKYHNVFSLEKDCFTYSEIQYLYNPFLFPGMKSPTYTFHLKLSPLCLALPCLFLALSSLFLLTNSLLMNTSGVNEEKKLMQSFVHYYCAQSSPYSVPFPALCFLSFQWLKPVREETAFMWNKALWRQLFSELLRVTVISIIQNSLMWQQFRKDKKKTNGI